MKWYVVQSKPKQEYRAYENLQAWKVETLLPQVRPPARRPRPTARVLPLFPGYLFARFDSDDTAAKVRFTRGVSKILGTPEGPSVVDDSIISLLRERMDNTGVVETTSQLRPGDKVRIVGGPMADFMGVFERSATATHRVTVLLSMLSSQVRVTIDPWLVERLR
jgi:transcriptional antiterminator RfaH